VATFLYRVGRLAFRRRWYVVLVWAAVLTAVGLGALKAPGAADEGFSMPGIESQKAFDLMEQRRLKDRPGSEAIDTAPDRPKDLTPAHAAKMKCPDCDAPLTRLKDVDRRDIEYEYCVVCNGAFFDGGEFRHYKDHSFLSSLRHLFGGHSK